MERPINSQPVESRLSWPNWQGQTAVCIATGPSLTAEQIAHVKRTTHPVIAINEGGLPQYEPLAAPWADILYAADRAWWQHYQPKRPPGQLHVSGEPVVQEADCNGKVIKPAVPTIALKMLEPNQPMPREPGSVVSGGHSGFQALGLALTLGASRVLLLGYDCGGGPTRNCHADRPQHFMRKVNMYAWADMYARVLREWPDVEVINCAQYSTITAFPKREVEDVL